MASRIRIVLVEPREAGNVGAAARAMKNFGFDDLAIVGDHPPLHPLADWWSSGASDVVDSASFHASLPGALGDCHLTVATTSMRGRSRSADLSLPDLGELRATMTDRQTMALVFGREDRGLTHEEAALCQRTTSIPTDPGFPTMNLAQSVAVLCYELTRPVAVEVEERELAPNELLERFHERFQALLLEAGFLQAENPDRVYEELRSWMARVELAPREVEILLAMVRQLEWRFGR